MRPRLAARLSSGRKPSHQSAQVPRGEVVGNRHRILRRSSHFDRLIRGSTPCPVQIQARGRPPPASVPLSALTTGRSRHPDGVPAFLRDDTGPCASSAQVGQPPRQRRAPGVGSPIPKPPQCRANLTQDGPGPNWTWAFGSAGSHGMRAQTPRGRQASRVTGCRFDSA